MMTITTKKEKRENTKQNTTMIEMANVETKTIEGMITMKGNGKTRTTSGTKIGMTTEILEISHAELAMLLTETIPMLNV
jgi:hypothetical protein